MPESQDFLFWLTSILCGIGLAAGLLLAIVGIWYLKGRDRKGK